MKKIILTLCVFALSLAGYTQGNSYKDAMLGNIKSLRKAKTIEDFQKTANNFERIANAEKDEWLPSYYTAFSYINICFMEQDKEKKDQYLDIAQKYIDRGKKIVPKESELYVLQGFLYQGRIQINPMIRGMKYSSMASASLEKAKTLNPDNPRAYYLIGQNLLHKPKMFGGGIHAACPVLKEAKIKFENFKPKSDIYPDWGKNNNLYLLKNCNKK